MTTVSFALEVPVHRRQAQALWVDVAHWGMFVEGFDRVEQLTPEWPAAGSTVVWQSTPHGRGRVREHIITSGDWEIRSEIDEQRLSGARTIGFVEADGDELTECARVDLQLDYRLKGPRLLMGVVDWLFVRRAMRESVRRELEDFARALSRSTAR